MDASLGYLFAAFFVTWLVVLLYLVVLSGRLKALEREVEALQREGRPSEAQANGVDSRPG
jgi:CcmD family protein